MAPMSCVSRRLSVRHLRPLGSRGYDLRLQYGLYRRHSRECRPTGASVCFGSDCVSGSMGGRMLYTFPGRSSVGGRLTRRSLWPPQDLRGWYRSLRWRQSGSEKGADEGSWKEKGNQMSKGGGVDQFHE